MPAQTRPPPNLCGRSQRDPGRGLTGSCTASPIRQLRQRSTRAPELFATIAHATTGQTRRLVIPRVTDYTLM